MKITYDGTKIDRTKTGGVPPKPGAYRMKVVEIKFDKANNDHPDRFIIKSQQQVPDDKGNGKGWHYWDYVNVDVTWRLDQYMMAAGEDNSAKKKALFDSDKVKDLEFLGRVKADSYEGNPGAKLASVLPLSDEEDSDDSDDDDEDIDDDEDEDGDEDSDDEDEDEEDSDDDDSDDDDSDDDEDEIDWDAVDAKAAKADAGNAKAQKELNALAESDRFELDPEDFDTWEDMVTAMRAAEGDDEDGDDSDEEDEEEEEDEPEEKPAAKKSSSAKKGGAAKKTEAPAKKGGSSKAKSKGPDYDAMSDADLKKELRDRELKTNGPRSAMITRLKAHDADPFS